MCMNYFLATILIAVFVLAFPYEKTTKYIKTDVEEAKCIHKYNPTFLEITWVITSIKRDSIWVMSLLISKEQSTIECVLLKKEWDKKVTLLGVITVRGVRNWFETKLRNCIIINN